MSSDLYLWTKNLVNISDKHMKMMDDFICEYTHNFNEDRYKEIIVDNRIPEKIRRKMEDIKFNSNIINSMKKEMKDYGVGYITYDDELYPETLKEIYDPPQVIYYYGDIRLLKTRLLLSIIGSRNCSQYGKNVSEYIVRELSQKGFTTVSGMAYGIDSLVHSVTIKNGAKTIAVLGTSIEKTYPYEAVELKKSIIESGGLVISEHPIGTESKRYYFALRNRIIAAISSGILVIEAKSKSGTFITVDCGLQYGKNIYAVPGSIFSELSCGCNKLIGEGAKPVSSVDDILDDYGLNFIEDEKNFEKVLKNTRNLTSTCDNISFDDKNQEDFFSEVENLIIEILKSEGAQDIDCLSIKTNVDISELLFSINNLLLKGFLVEEGINKYALNILK